MKTLFLILSAAILGVGTWVGSSYLKNNAAEAAAPVAARTVAVTTPAADPAPAQAASPKAHKLAATPSKTAPKNAGTETPVAQDASTVFKTPKGAKAAIVVFEDLQCPQCSRAAPQLEKASATYKIPVMRHDFPLPKHDWSLQAAIIARYFDQTSKELGNQFRDYIFSNQPQINPDNLRAYADTFANAHKISLPFVVDPQGKLVALIDQDKNLGQQIHLDHTPTIYVVSAKPGFKPAEVPADLNTLYSLIDSAMKQ